MTPDPANLRLEVEVPGTGLPNLVQNPSGELGAWGYITPVASTALTSDGTRLTFSTTVSQAANLTTELLPVAATKYVAARVDLLALTTGHNVKVRYEWYDATKTLISSSAQTGALSALGTTHYPGTYQAPAGTAYVKLRFDLYSGTTNPAAGASFAFNRLMVTWQDTGTVSTTRTNLIPNPSLETTATGWSILRAYAPPGGSGGMTVARSTAQAYAGAASLAVTATSGNTGKVGASAALVPVTGGKAYTISVYARPSTTARRVRVTLQWEKASGVRISDSISGWTNEVAGTWTRRSLAATAPSTAAQVVVNVEFEVSSGDPFPHGEVHYIDAVLLEQSATANPYFDGSTVKAGFTYAWTGTGHGSTSTETTTGSTFDFSEPNDWRDILGPTHQIKISRRGLDVGLLSATILDPLLDPSVEDDLRPGKKVRVRALAGTKWESLFEGRVSGAEVSYVPRTRIQLNASDNVAQVANQSESRGVASIANLAWLMEGRGVPWNVNGSGNQAASAATVVAKNDNASLLDQIAITRDSALGFAWVSRNNVLCAYDKTSMPATSVATLDETTYSGLDVSFNTEQCINEVLVKYLRYNAKKGETTEVPYGPYRDATSVATWGPRRAEFSIQGGTESASAMQAYANSILAANAIPKVRVNSVRVPIRSAADITTSKALLDLYDLVTVVNTKAATNEASRITGIEHSITPGKWLLDLTFAVEGSVAAPTLTPSPPVQPAQATSATAGVVTPASGYSVNVQDFYREGRVVHCNLSIQRTGANVALTTPDYANQTLGTLAAGWRPVVFVSTITHDGFRAVVIRPDGTIVTTGGLADASYTSSGINTNNVMAFGLTYLLPEGV